MSQMERSEELGQKHYTNERYQHFVDRVLHPETPNGMVEGFDDWAETYDKDTDTTTHNKYGPVQEIFTELNIAKDARILDLAAGTGLLGEYLYKDGYKNQDAIDASTCMLKKAEEKKIYKRIICDFVGANRLDINADEYDFIVGVGCLLSTFINESSFEELVRITKPGGHILFLISIRNIENCRERMEAKMDQMDKDGLWKKKEAKIVPNYLGGNDGICYLLQKSS